MLQVNSKLMDSSTSHNSRSIWTENNTVIASNLTVHDDRVTSPVFHVKSIIGEGCFAVVYEAITDEGLKVAIKVEKPYFKRLIGPTLVEERDILAELHHENIIKILAAFQNNKLEYIVLEIAEKGTLEDYVKNHDPISEETAAMVAYQLMNALSYCHEKYIIHGDISLDNVAVMNDDLHVKLIDFGIGMKFNTTEISRESTNKMKITQKRLSYDDVKGVGIVVWKLLFGLSSTVGTKKRGKKTMLRFPARKSISDNAKSTLQGLLFPKRNLSTRQIFEMHCACHGDKFEFKKYASLTSNNFRAGSLSRKRTSILSRIRRCKL